jgi:hypothetical protein
MQSNNLTPKLNFAGRSSLFARDMTPFCDSYTHRGPFVGFHLLPKTQVRLVNSRGEVVSTVWLQKGTVGCHFGDTIALGIRFNKPRTMQVRVLGVEAAEIESNRFGCTITLVLYPED